MNIYKKVGVAPCREIHMCMGRGGYEAFWFCYYLSLVDHIGILHRGNSVCNSYGKSLGVGSIELCGSL